MDERGAMKEVCFVVPGEPIGKGRPRFSRYGRSVRTYTPERTASYENLVKISYPKKAPKLKGDISVALAAYFAVPKSTSKKKAQKMLSGEIKPAKKPDADNIAKAVLDSLNGIAYDDDAQVIRLLVVKLYSETPHVEVSIIGEVDEEE